MDALLEGYQRFRKSGWPERRGIFERLAEAGQRPAAMVVACVDSRVDPTVIFDAAPGQLLTVPTWRTSCPIMHRIRHTIALARRWSMACGCLR
jgi:carbonic anhydrase